MRRRREVISLSVLLLASAATSASAVRAAEWRLFGVDDFSGNLTWKSVQEVQNRDGKPDRERTLEQQTHFRLASYVLHPRFLFLTADTSVALRDAAKGRGGFRNLDSGLALDFLREHRLSFGVAGRRRVEDLERDFKDYQRNTAGGAAHASFRAPLLSASVRYETAETKSPLGGYFPEDRLRQRLSLTTGLRMKAVDDLSLRYQAISVDDRLSASHQSMYQTAELTGERSILDKRGRVSGAMTAWQSRLPRAETRLGVRQNWVMNWSPQLRTSENLEISQWDRESDATTTYRASFDAQHTLCDRWDASYNFGATKNVGKTSGSSVYRLAGGIGYRQEVHGYQVAARNTLTLMQSYAGPEKTVPVRDLGYNLPTAGGWEPLPDSYIDSSTITVTDENGLRDWSQFCAIKQVGTATYLAWQPTTAEQELAEYPAEEAAGQLIHVHVSYSYVLPETNYAELTDLLSLRATREFAPGLGIESNVDLRTTVPGTAGRGFSGLNFAEARYETGLQGFYRRPAYEVGVGVTAGPERKTVFLQGNTVWKGWSWSESYRREVFSDFVGQNLESKVSRIWGLSQKTNLSAEAADRMYLSDGRLTQGLTSARVRAAYLLNPFMRLQVEGRGEHNRVIENDTKLALDAKYLWQQGQLDLVAQYGYTRRLYDRFTSHRCSVSLIRRF